MRETDGFPFDISDDDPDLYPFREGVAEMHPNQVITMELLGSGDAIIGAQLVNPKNPDAFVRCGKRDFKNLSGMR